MARLAWDGDLEVSKQVKVLMRKQVDRVVHGAIGAASRVLPFTSPRRNGVSVVRDVPYKSPSMAAHRLDVFSPERSSRPSRQTQVTGRAPPAVVYIHGGAFSIMSKETHRYLGVIFAQAGFVTFNINYRLGPEYRYPSQLQDCAAALCWVGQNAARFGADPERIVLAGDSAGANLVTALAYSACYDCPEPWSQELATLAHRIKAVVPFYGILDLVDVARFYRDKRKRKKMGRIVRNEIDYTVFAYVGDNPRAARLAHPLRLLESPEDKMRVPLPPFFVTAGTKDPVLDDSRRLHEAIRKLGGTSELSIYVGEIHGFNVLPFRTAAKTMWADLFSFLRVQTEDVSI